MHFAIAASLPLSAELRSHDLEGWGRGASPAANALNGSPVSGEQVKERKLPRCRTSGIAAMFYAEFWPPPVTVDAFGYRNITDHSFLKVYHKDPAHAFSHNARPTNGDSRVSTLPRRSADTAAPALPSVLLYCFSSSWGLLKTPPTLNLFIAAFVPQALFCIFWWGGVRSNELCVFFTGEEKSMVLHSPYPVKSS